MELLEDCVPKGYERAGVAAGVDRRINLLEPADRKLLQLTLQQRLTRREVGALVGLTSGAVTRRVHALLRRVNSPMVKALIERGDLLPEDYKGMGLAYFLRGWSVKQICRHFRRSSYEVRRMITYLQGWRGEKRKRK